MRTLLWLAVLTTGCSAGRPLEFTMRTSPGAPRFERPHFQGASDAAMRLNRWVDTVNDDDCVGAHARRLSVARTTAHFVLFTDALDESCGAHPTVAVWQHIVEVQSGRAVEVWSELAPQRRAELQAWVGAEGRKAFAGGPCAELYRSPPEFIDVAFEASGVELTPDFGSPGRACSRGFVMPLVELRKKVDAGSVLEQVLGELE